MNARAPDLSSELEKTFLKLHDGLVAYIVQGATLQKYILTKGRDCGIIPIDLVKIWRQKSINVSVSKMSVCVAVGL